MESLKGQQPYPIVDVPFDVWSHIASFLSAAHRQTLYPVNHAFFVIAMDERYNNIQLPSQNGERTSRTLSRLKYAHRAQRVHTLQLGLDALAEYLIQNPVLVLKRHLRSKGPPISEPNTLISRADLLLQTIGSMTNLRKLIMFTTMKPTSPRMRALEFCIRIIMARGSSTFGSTLRSLMLSLSYEGYVYALTQTIVFPGLEELNLHISWSPNRPVSDGPNLMRNLLVPFLNNHHSTLHSLGLHFGSFSPLTNISSQLVGMDHLPRLRKLDIFDVSTKSDDSGLRHILEIHADSLLELRLDFALDARTSRTEWYSRGMLHVALPHLESLRLGAGCFVDFELTAAYIQRLGNSLTTVKLDPARLSYTEAKTLVNAFSGQTTLRKLYLSVDNLSPELLDLLATKLPGLIFLKLNFNGVCISESHPKTEAEERLFCQCMRDRVYSNWKLHHFIASFNGSSRKEDVLPQWEAAIDVALPLLQTLRVERGWKGS